ncbi:MAG: amidohydrolase [Deltaproteobacteria bacterium]|nr:amidohydrolase [Deltaproteobacteria bacterium]
MKTLIYNTLLVTMNADNEIIENGALIIENKILSYVGPVQWLPTDSFDRTINAERLIAIPGLINAHCHSPANLVRGLFASRPLEIWRAYYRASLRDMTEEDFYASALLGGMEMLKSGATTVLDHFFGNQTCRFMGAGAAIQAMRDLGLRHVVSLTLSDRKYEETIPLGETSPDLRSEVERMSQSETRETRAWLDDCEAFIAEFHDPEKLTTCCPGPSAVQRCSDELLRGAAEISKKGNLPIHIHLAESKSQKVMGEKLYGESLLGHLESLGVLGPNVSLAHGIWIDRQDIARIADSGATLVHNPASNLRLGSGLAPVTQLLALGGHVALGTDGAASNDGQNMFDAIRLAALIHNPGTVDFRQWVTPAQALKMGTGAGARAFGLACGTLAPGQLADFVLLRRDTAAFTPLNDVTNQLVLCENGSSVDTVIVSGEIVVEGGRIARMDEQEILHLANRARERLNPSIRRELAAAQSMEAALAEMYFQVVGKGDG